MEKFDRREIERKSMQPKDEILLNKTDLEISNDDDDLEKMDVGTDDKDKMQDQDYQFTLEYIKTDEGELQPDESEETIPDRYKLVKVVEDEEPLEDELEGGEELENEFEMEELDDNDQPIVRESAFDRDLEELDDTGAPMGEEGLENSEDGLEKLDDEEGLDELENEGEYEFDRDELLDFLDTQELEYNMYIDDQTEFAVEEALEYLKLYPDNKIYLKVDDVVEFEKSIDEFFETDEELTDEIENDEDNVTLDLETLESPDETGDNTENKQSNDVQFESFAAFRMRGKTNLTDGVYVGHLLESKLYGPFKDIKFTSSNVLIKDSKFAIDPMELNTLRTKLKESKEDEEINFNLKDGEKFLNYLKENSEIVIKLK